MKQTASLFFKLTIINYYFSKFEMEEAKGVVRHI
jgi:hypothetical protein